MKVYTSELARYDESVLIGVYTSHDAAFTAAIITRQNNADYAKYEIEVCVRELDAMPSLALPSKD